MQMSRMALLEKGVLKEFSPQAEDNTISSWALCPVMLNIGANISLAVLLRIAGTTQNYDHLPLSTPC